MAAVITLHYACHTLIAVKKSVVHSDGHYQKHGAQRGQYVRSPETTDCDRRQR